MMNPNELEETDQWHEALLRVRYAETDKMGVVYHANYLIWFEIGRTEFCRARGFLVSRHGRERRRVSGSR